MSRDFQIKNGLVHVYTGEGKGKTTVSLGLALRCIGWGGRVCMAQFIKGYAEIGEAGFALKHPDSFVLKQFAMDSARSIDPVKVVQRQREAELAMEYVELTAQSLDFDLLILDEINNAMHYGLVDTDRVLRLMRNKPENLELVLTGRNAPQSVIEAADYCTYLQMVNHPYEKNIQARAGIDY